MKKLKLILTKLFGKKYFIEYVDWLEQDEVLTFGHKIYKRKKWFDLRNLEIKGSNAVQSLGGVQTYLTRYLYIQLLNIVEADVFDATSGKEDKNNIKKSIQTNDNKEARELTKEEYKRVIDGFTKISNKNKVGA